MEKETSKAEIEISTEAATVVKERKKPGPKPKAAKVEQTKEEIKDLVEPEKAEDVSEEAPKPEPVVESTMGLEDEAPAIEESAVITEDESSQPAEPNHPSDDEEPIESVKSETALLKRPTVLYKGPKLGTQFVDIVGRIKYIGEPIKGFIKVSTSIPGQGRVVGYIRNCDMPK